MKQKFFNDTNGVVSRYSSWIKWPLGPLFAFFDHIKKVTINLSMKLSLKCKSNDLGYLLFC